MRVTCPHCDRSIPTSQMNVATDVALCHDCDEAFAISKLVGANGAPLHHPDLSETVSATRFDIHNPPSGVRYDHYGMGWRIAAMTRNASAFFLVPFMCVWSGFSLGGIYGGQIIKGEFDLFASLFGIPFILGTLLFGSIALMSVIGRVVISADEMDPDRGAIFTGIGPIGWTRRFHWSEVRAVTKDVSYSSQGSPGRSISLRRGETDITFGSMLSEKRRKYVLNALRQIAVTRGA